MTKHILITGAANGLGWAIAYEYWQQGYHLHLLDRDSDRLAMRANQLGHFCSTYAVDLLDDLQLESFCRTFTEQKTELDILVNNAGITHRSKASSTKLGVFDRVMKLNWQVPVRLARKLLPLLERRQGKIICMASMAALMPVPGRAAYCASKSAMAQHFETWRPELLKKEITLLLVFPSFVATSIEQNALGADGIQTQKAQSKIGKVITPQAMAKRIIKAQIAHQQRLYSPQLVARLGYWIWFLLPKLHQRLVWRKFSGEID